MERMFFCLLSSAQKAFRYWSYAIKFILLISVRCSTAQVHENHKTGPAPKFYKPFSFILFSPLRLDPDDKISFN